MSSPPAPATKPLHLLVLGSPEGWHAQQLTQAAATLGHALSFAPYESLAASLTASSGPPQIRCEAGPLDRFAAVLTRTMPAGSLEQIIFRLTCLRTWQQQGGIVVNGPQALEMAIDKFATLAHLGRLGHPIPPTVVVQSRREAMDAFQSLGGDVIAKPLFGGEGRGVMRIQDRELAWFSFATLERLDAICYVQQFVPPGGRDTRLLVIGDQVWGVRRTGLASWRTNVSQGATCEAFPVSAAQRTLALEVAAAIGLEIGSVDLLDRTDGPDPVVEVNAVPGWKGAQRVIAQDLAAMMLEHVAHRCHASKPMLAPESPALPAE